MTKHNQLDRQILTGQLYRFFNDYIGDPLWEYLTDKKDCRNFWMGHTFTLHTDVKKSLEQ